MQEILTAENIYVINSKLEPEYIYFNEYNSNIEYKTELNDSYMNITYFVTDLGNANLKFYIDATWIKMPFFRMNDSLGAICMNTTVINSSRRGFIEYEINNNGNIKREEISNGKLYNAINGNWFGSACAFPLTTLVEGSLTAYKIL